MRPGGIDVRASVGGSIVAYSISSHHFVGCMGFACNQGSVALAIAWPATLFGFNALLWVFSPFYLRNGFHRMPKSLEKEYGAPARAAYAGLVLLSYTLIQASAVLACGMRSLLGLQSYST